LKAGWWTVGIERRGVDDDIDDDDDDGD